MEIIRATSDAITVSLEPDDAVAINNALNEICNGVHLDEWDFQTRMGVDREQARKVLHAIGAAIDVMKERRQAEGKEW
ncbi:hypothetical protein [Microbispora corallina]|uniref:hypothetical protein n=1 Tax=Microbispora corallina TaxID=83302 RepID=UPI0019525F40|nr:hypothetical protein [Microbispora corallina]